MSKFYTQEQVQSHTLRLVVASRNARKCVTDTDANGNKQVISGVAILHEVVRHANTFVVFHGIREGHRTTLESALLKALDKAVRKLKIYEHKARKQMTQTLIAMNVHGLEYVYGKVNETTPDKTFALLDEFEKFEDDGGMEIVKQILPKHLFKQFKGIAYDFVNKTLEENAIVAKFLHNDLCEMIENVADKIELPEAMKLQFLKLKGYKLTTSELRTKIRKWKYSIGRTNNEATKAELQAKIEETEALIATMEA